MCPWKSRLIHSVVVFTIFIQIQNGATENIEVNTAEIFQFWNDKNIEAKSKLSLLSERKSVVLALGTTGAGKSTLLSFLSGANLEMVKSVKFDDTDSDVEGSGSSEDNVISEEDEEMTMLSLRDVNNRISNGSATTSFTIVPEVLLDQSTDITYVDCPGFEDTRGPIHDISVTYFIRKMLRQVESIKLLFMVSEYSVRPESGDRNAFLDFALQITNFIRDIKKYRNGIALVITKIDGTQSDKYYINAAAEFLRDTKNDISKRGLRNKNQIIEFIDILLEKKRKGKKLNYFRISTFRMAHQPGPLEEDPKLVEERDYIRNILQTKLSFVKKNDSDFDFAVSDKTKNSVNDLISDVEKVLLRDVTTLSSEIHTFYSNQEQQFSNLRDWNIWNNIIRTGRDYVSKMNSTEPETFVQQMHYTTSDLNIRSAIPTLQHFTENLEFINFLVEVSKRDWVFPYEFNIAAMNDMMKYFDKETQWLDFVNSTSKIISEQHDLESTLAIGRTNPTEINANRSLESIFDGISSIETMIPHNFDMNAIKLQMLDTLLENVEYFEVECVSDTQIIAKGYNIRISDVIEVKCWPTANVIKIFALNTIFVDVDIDKTGAEAEFVMIAPTWNMLSKNLRTIVLDGEDGLDFDWQATEEMPGLSGIRGGSGGHFIGIGHNFVNGRLSISANGGNGGAGQQGGNGKDGVNGADVTREELENIFQEGAGDSFNIVHQMPSTLRELWNDRGFECESSTKGIFSWDLLTTVHGKAAKPPTNGANGGKGGLGGMAGTIVVLGTDIMPDIHISKNNGKNGDGGKGGSGGKSARGGTSIAARYVSEKVDSDNFFTFSWHKRIRTYRFAFWRYNLYLVIDNEWNGEWTKTGKDGLEGSRDEFQLAHSNVPSHNVNDFAIDYKSVARSYLARDLRGLESSQIENFIEFMDNHVDIQFEDFDFIAELTSLENQYYQLRDEVSFVPFLESLLNRIHSTKETAASSDALDFVYAATLSKLNAITNPIHNMSILNLIEYKNTNKKHIITLRDATHLINVHDNYEQYDQSIMEQIRSINYLIQNEIMPEIENAFTTANDNLLELVDEIVFLEQNQADKFVLESKKRSLEKSILMSNILGCLQVLSVPLMLAGSFGMAIRTGIGALKARVDGEPQQGATTHDTGDSSSINYALVKLNEEFRSQQEFNKLRWKTYDKDQVNVVFKEEPELVEISNQIDKDIIDNDPPKPEIICRIRKSMKAYEELVAKRSLTYKRTMVIDGRSRESVDVSKVLKLTWKTGVDFLKNLEHNNNKLKVINDQIESLDEKLKEFETFKENIYNDLFPRLRVFESDFHSKSNMSGKSQAELDIIKWKNQNWMTSIVCEFKKLTGKFEAGKSLTQTINKLGGVMNMLTEVYGRIETQLRHKEFAHYLAKLQSSSLIDTIDDDSTIPIANLKKIIECNLMLEQYELFMYALQQHKFPFAQAFTTNFALDKTLESRNVTQIANSVIATLDDLEEKITKSEITLTEYDRDLKSDILFGDDYRPAFYTWKHVDIAEVLPKLLRGDAITLDANIANGINETAVKFNEIHLRFKANDKSIDEELQESLSQFDNRLTLVGQRFYRCGNRIYAMPNDGNVIIEQTFMLNPNTKRPKETNDVYKKLMGKNSDYFLSPYGLWKIKLKSHTNNFDSLKKFEYDNIDLELIGQGQIIDSNSEFISRSCNENLDKYYDFYCKVDDQVTEKNHKSKFNEFLD